MIEISKGTTEILMEARRIDCDREKLKKLINEHGIDAAAEALDYLGQFCSAARHC